MKKRFAAAIATCMVFEAFTLAAYAYTIEVSDRPYDVAMLNNEGYAVVSGSAISGSSNVIVAGEPSTEVSPGDNGTAPIAGGSSAPSASVAPSALSAPFAPNTLSDDTSVSSVPSGPADPSAASAQSVSSAQSVPSGLSVPLDPTGLSVASVPSGPTGPLGSTEPSGPAAPSALLGTLDSLAGSMYSSDPVVSMDLGFTLVTPIASYGDFKVAEGSVQLSDGSWATIGHEYLLKGSYKLLREATDSTGKGWYVVDAYASNLGTYFTPDGSFADELWLVKDECMASNTFSLNTSDPVRQSIVRTALSLLGLPYVYGKDGPDAFDCSGFVSYVMNQNGISLPRSSDEICNAGVEVGLEGLRPGDIIGRTGHVGIYVGGGRFVHASETNAGVVMESLDVYNATHEITNYRSVVN